jgi:hypothetical protein
LLAAFLVVGVSDGQAKGGVPITACAQTVAQNAYLAQNLTCPSEDGIDVGAPGITIDLGGHLLRGNDAIGHDGIYVQSNAGVRIMNGTIRDFEDGIQATPGADNLAITNVAVSGNVYGAYLEVNGVVISSSSFSGNDGHGIFINGYGFTFTSSSADGNHTDGIYGPFASAAKIQSSDASGNCLNGFDLAGVRQTIRGSTASGNGFVGFYIDGDLAQIRGNRAEGNGFHGGSDGSGVGILNVDYAVAPVSSNIARGNDDPAECDPVTLC